LNVFRSEKPRSKKTKAITVPDPLVFLITMQEVAQRRASEAANAWVQKRAGGTKAVLNHLLDKLIKEGKVRKPEGGEGDEKER